MHAMWKRWKAAPALLEHFRVTDVLFGLSGPYKTPQQMYQFSKKFNKPLKNQVWMYNAVLDRHRDKTLKEEDVTSRKLNDPKIVDGADVMLAGLNLREEFFMVELPKMKLPPCS